MPVVEAGADPEGGDLPPKTCESNFIHPDFVQFGNKHSRYKANLSSIVWSQHCCEVCFISLTVGKSYWDLTTKCFWNRPSPLNLLAGSAPVEASMTSSSFINNRPIPVLASQRLSSSVSCAIRFLFLDLTCFILETVLLHTCFPNIHCMYSAKSLKFRKYIFAY